MTTDSFGLVLLLLFLLAWRIWMCWHPRNQDRPAIAAQIQRLLKPVHPMIAPAVASRRRPHSQPHPLTFRRPRGASAKAVGALPSELPHRDLPARIVPARTIR
jgi:hypothetical protein